MSQWACACRSSGVASQGKIGADRREKLAAELFLFIFDSRPRRPGPGSTAHLQRPARDAALVRHRLSWYNSQDSRGLSWKGSRGIGRHKVKTTARRFHYNLCINWPFELRSLTRKIFFDFNFIFYHSDTNGFSPRSLKRENTYVRFMKFMRVLKFAIRSRYVWNFDKHCLELR